MNPEQSDTEELVSASDVVGTLVIPPLPDGESPSGLLAFVQTTDKDAIISWSVRVTSNLHDEEVLGLLVGYVDHLRQEAAAGWSD